MVRCRDESACTPPFFPRLLLSVHAGVFAFRLIQHGIYIEKGIMLSQEPVFN